MDFHFNLLDDPWIYGVREPNAPPELLSLRAVLHQAASLQRIVDARPTTTIAIHRLLLALLHRALDGPHTESDWRAVWGKGTWDIEKLNGYLQKKHDRFNLFEPQHPFYQTPGLDPERAMAVSTLAHDRASSVNNPMIFDHQLKGASATPAEAARWLIGQQQFATPGLISDDQSPAGKVSANASPLMGSLVCLAQGHTLFETLMLNWVQYDPAHDLPFPFDGDDQPVWEREPPRFRQERRPNGYADWLTWASRRILLVPECDAQGQTVVRRAVLMDGTRTPPDFPIWDTETMVAFHHNDKPDALTPWPAVRLDPDRAIWRESHALLHSVVQKANPPRVLSVWATLAPRALVAREVKPLAIAGVIFHQKNVVNWSQDILALPRDLLTSEPMLGALHEALQFAETMGKLLRPTEIKLGPKGNARPTPMKVLAAEFVKGLGERVPQSKDYHNVAEHLGVSRDYWAGLDLPFRRFLQGLPDALTRDVDGTEVVGGIVQRQWLAAVIAACNKAFDGALASLGETTRALRARAIAEISFAQCRKVAAAQYLMTLEGDNT